MKVATPPPDRPLLCPCRRPQARRPRPADVARPPVSNLPALAATVALSGRERAKSSTGPPFRSSPRLARALALGFHGRQRVVRARFAASRAVVIWPSPGRGRDRLGRSQETRLRKRFGATWFKTGTPPLSLRSSVDGVIAPEPISPPGASNPRAHWRCLALRHAVLRTAAHSGRDCALGFLMPSSIQAHPSPHVIAGHFRFV